MARKFLQGTAYILELFCNDRRTKIDPSVAIFSAFLLTSMVSFSHDIRVYLIYILFSLIFMLIFRASYRRVIILATSWFFFIFAIYIPKIIIEPNMAIPIVAGIQIMINKDGFIFGLKSALRTTAAILIFGTILCYLGWRNIAIGLRKIGLPEKFTFMFTFFIRFLPYHLRYLARLLFARESRIIVGGYKKYWLILSTVVGDLLINSTYVSQRFLLGLKSRGFDLNIPKERIKIGISEILFLFAVFLVMSLHVAIEFLKVI